MKGDDDADSDEDSKRVVRSHKDKKWDQMTTEISNMKNHIKINDWCATARANGRIASLVQSGSVCSLFLSWPHLPFAAATIASAACCLSAWPPLAISFR